MTLEHVIDLLNKTGYEIADEREGGLGFIVRKSPYQDFGASLHYSDRRGFYVSVGARERSHDEILELGNALINLGSTARMLNEAEK